MKSALLFKILLRYIAGPAAGAFGLWLATEAPAVYSAVCTSVL